ASNPNALPPDNVIACTFSTKLVGRSRSVSLVPGAEPLTSTPQTAPSSAMATVHPVSASSSSQFPTLMPGTSVIFPYDMIDGSFYLLLLCPISIYHINTYLITLSIFVLIPAALDLK